MYGAAGSLNYVSERNNYRFKPYHRLDLSVTYTKHHKRGKSLWNLSVYNVYNNMNPFLVTPVSEKTGDHSYRTVLQQVTIFPILPNISYTYSF